VGIVGFELFIALRYLLARRRQAFISVISLISTLGVAVGVMALVVALALMTGVQRELRDRILGSTAHVTVWRVGGFTDHRADVERLAAMEGVIGAAPVLMDQALITSASATAPITLKGVDAALEPRVTELGTAMQEGRLAAIDEVPEDGVHGILLGKSLADRLGVAVGDPVQLLNVEGRSMSPGGMLPRPRTARVVGIYSFGLYEFDAAYGFVSLDFAQRMMRREQPSQIQVKLTDPDDAPDVARTVPGVLGPAYWAEAWQETNQPLFSALWLEKMGLSIAIGLIVAVAALNIVASLILLVMEKSRDIAILKTMGLSSPRVMRIFMLQGLIIGLVGTGAGGLGGLALCWVLDRYELIHISMDVYQIAHVPFVVLPRDLAIVMVSAIVVCFVATLYPSRQASRLDPVQALRFE
jgi:lipoprotein-releasing system permease protein